MIRIELGHLSFTSTSARTPQAACRKAFKHWIKEGQLKRQPKTDDDGGFVGVTYEILKEKK